MTIKQQGGIFGRNPAFNDVEVNSLGIGTQAPTAVDLEINASVPRFQLTDADNSAYTQFLFNTGSFAVDVDPTEAGGSSKFTIDVDNVRHFELNSSGDLTLETGNLVIGTSGKGIDFSATAGTGTSELFSDYEEGNWSPTLVGNTSAGTYSIAASGCTYTKVGRLVTVMGKMTITVSSAGSGLAKFGGLPFTTSGDSVAVGTAVSKNVDLDNSTISLAFQPWTSNTTEFAISSVRDNSTTATLDGSGISTGDFIIINTTYIT